MSLLTVENLRVSYGQIEALKGVSLHVERGEVVAILGSNGAGKTTLMRALSGLLKPKSGKLLFEGEDIVRRSADSIVRLGIGQSPEGRRVFGTLTVAENLRLGGYTRPNAEISQSCKTVYGIFPQLYERRTQLAGTLSGGEQQMVAIGRALVSKPKLLLLDEPSLGLAPIIIREIFRVLGEIRKTGVTILLVEQNARTALKLADRGYVLEVGRCVHEAPAKELLASPEMQAAYLGHA
ncbi:High-affinity branched-chain amino acid transport ATP-binding protein LivF [Paraburkholderia aspalathi]|uniref:High-affinity branched-chain amino acid transport ATP-binding protein LivF n=1 Tax=Paraburkholderia aspalathi TaxID=1324617 RepID=A0ABM8T4Q6_9BURK|nr:ABC transporter ATP-binding protein [Paraburkholderia aspalathi]MBK3823718.1 ABC transporter ATP-binding protein [Paraburkholderia aspalathi]MBK3835567.1 ABC transporter ATP-binding protein [Paraburkholderia aspalathi]MBK3865323.1 ABC transporter ATP-binding protein [Paraburkholderia aspalathi]CAE6856304.1 High-affinity branched-chain amino acid transport ATP-binding protein LivF [Paraburkholderia aspalathi]